MSNYRRENLPKSIYYAKRYVMINSEGDKYSIDKECILFVDQKRKINSLLVGSLDDISTLLTAVENRKVSNIRGERFQKMNRTSCKPKPGGGQRIVGA